MTGIGAMLGMLSEDGSSKACQQAFGKKISNVIVEDDLQIMFEDGTSLIVSDEGQSCCEHRYMDTDDALDLFKDSTLKGLELLDVEDVDDGECHEIQFLKITTDKGDFRIASHNEHNGYYGGFSIRARYK